ncbi:MAG: TetR/AcrR family transcriptional regulator [Oscillospiraceae bacterium]|nr:TetR/AcrR family transcriptional regulator [Oscillospiraceae bacterium]
MEKKENQRIMLTKQLLQTAFLKLLQLKPIHAISIRELCAEAGINRTTFYYHYGSQYDLLADISGRFLDSIARCLKDADGNGQEGIQQRVTLVLHYIEDNLELSALLLNNSIDPTFAERLFSLQQITDLLHLALADCTDEPKRKATVTFAIHGSYKLLCDWINDPERFLRNCRRSVFSVWQDVSAAIWPDHLS